LKNENKNAQTASSHQHSHVSESAVIFKNFYCTAVINIMYLINKIRIVLLNENTPAYFRDFSSGKS